MIDQMFSLLSTGNKLYMPLLLFLLLDYITGVCIAIKEKKLSSSVGFKGLTKKALIFVVIFLGWIIDQYIIGYSNATESLLLMFYLSNEGISILENLTQLGIPFPQKIAKIMNNLFTNQNEDQTKEI